VYNAVGRYADAVSAVKEYLEVKPDDAKALMALGEAYEGLDQVQNAIEAYTGASKDSKWTQYATYKVDELKKSVEEE
jgi:tetratricopeptide (TPR) repeat protein